MSPLNPPPSEVRFPNADIDSGSTAVSENGTGGRFFEIVANESVSSFENVPLALRLQLVMPPGIDYDLYVTTSGANCDSRCTSAAPVGVDESITAVADDPLFTGDDSFTAQVEVRFRSGSVCAPWTLNISRGSASAP